MKTVKNLLIIALSVLMFGACTSNSDSVVPQEKVGLIGNILYGGDINEDIILKEGQTYTLTKGVHLKSGHTFTIEAGVTLVANADVLSYILIEKGASIHAVGTKSAPIVMTSSREIPGAWGGLMICGNATINVDGGSGISEVGNAPYGGNNDNDNSGVLKYIRLEYTGYAFDEEHESNGVAFYGVGSGTQVDYIQVYKGSDDGFEFFGGTVSANYLVSTASQDDSFDWTEGWRGQCNYWVAVQNGDSKGTGFESDNLSGNTDATPRSQPVISNITLIGNGTSQAMNLRRGTGAILSNLLMTNFTSGVGVEQSSTGKLIGTELTISNSILTNAITDANKQYFTYVKTTESTERTAVEGSNFGTGVGVGEIALTNTYVGTINGAGAVATDNDWTEGWTK
ncbi:hypothetical protein K4L44_01490 [Halosquirtibacter laminarini]|uniref:Uncharacterized protein n=1 Tax=Halosquirtibacter laminarini TaxID=3374600 RepID=A0AC61NG22_9BACT|nr:hypothetical protein K4L44_01490 [Prolixibacteraceae bacterium]